MEEEYSNTDVLTALQSIMAMPLAQRSALKRAWLAIEPSEAVIRSDSVEPLSEPNDEEVEDDLTPWLDSISALPKRKQYSLLEEALGNSHVDSDKVAISMQMRQLRDDDAIFAIEVGITKYAYEHPVLMVMGLVGVAFGIYNFGVRALRIMF